MNNCRQFPLAPDLREAIELLERPVRECNIAHEDIDVSKPPTGGLGELEFLEECAAKKQHGACPHVWERIFLLIGDITEIFPDDAELKAIVEQMDKQRISSLRIDQGVRKARTGATINRPFLDEIPKKESAEEAASIFIDKFNTSMHSNAFAELRIQAATKLRQILLRLPV